MGCQSLEVAQVVIRREPGCMVPSSYGNAERSPLPMVRWMTGTCRLPARRRPTGVVPTVSEGCRRVGGSIESGTAERVGG
jgi:hypothetical protein